MLTRSQWTHFTKKTTCAIYREGSGTRKWPFLAKNYDFKFFKNSHTSFLTHFFALICPHEPSGRIDAKKPTSAIYR